MIVTFNIGWELIFFSLKGEKTLHHQNGHKIKTGKKPQAKPNPFQPQAPTKIL